MATSDNSDTRLSTEINNRDASIDLSRVEPIFDIINRAESYGNLPLVNPYGIWHGSPFDAGLESMTIKEVMKAQKARQEDGKSTPAGKYQILDDTLEWLVKHSKYKDRFDLDDKFDKDTQDQLAYALLEHRGLNEFLLGEPGAFEKFKKGLATEWAGLPDETGESYWQGAGVNKANATISELDEALLATVKEPEQAEAPQRYADLNRPEKRPSNPAVELGNLNIEDYDPEPVPLGVSDFDFDRANRGMLSEIDVPQRRKVPEEALAKVSAPDRDMVPTEALGPISVPPRDRVPEEALAKISVPNRGGRFPEVSVPERSRVPEEALAPIKPTQRGQVPIPQPKPPAPDPESEPRLESELASTQMDIQEAEESPVKIEPSKVESTFERDVVPEKVERISESYDEFLPTAEEIKENRAAKKAAVDNRKLYQKANDYDEFLPDSELRDFSDSYVGTELRRGARTVAQGLSAGTSDELEAGLRALFTDTPYGEARESIMRDIQEQRLVRPTTALFQDIGGGLLSGGALVSQLTKRGVSAARAGALEGGLMGAGYGEGIEGKALSTAGFAAFGGTLGKAVDWATTPSSKAMRATQQGGKTKADDAIDTEVERLTERAMLEAEEAGQYQYVKAGPAGTYQQKQFSYLEEAPYEAANRKQRYKVLRVKKDKDGNPVLMPSGKVEWEMQDLTWRNAMTAGEFFDGIKFGMRDFYDQKLTPASDYVMREVAPRVGAIFQRYSETALRTNTIAFKTIIEPMEPLIKAMDEDKMLKAMVMDYTNMNNLLAHNQRIAQARKEIGDSAIRLRGELEQTITTRDDLLRYIGDNYGQEQAANFQRYLEWNKAKKAEHVDRLSGDDELIRANEVADHIHTRKRKKNPEEEPEDILEEINMRPDDAKERRTRLSMVDNLNDVSKVDKVDSYFNPLLTDFRRTSNYEVLNQMARMFNLKKPGQSPNVQPSDVFEELFRTLISRGISPEQSRKAVNAMKDDFIGQAKTPHNWLQFFNSWGYAGSLAGPKSALLNLHDIPMAAVIYGPHSLKGVFKKMGYNVSDKGIVQRVGEFQNYVNEQMSLGQRDLAKQMADHARKGTDLLMKYSAFGWADEIGKNAITRMIIQDAVDNVDNLSAKWGFYFSKSELDTIAKQIRKHGTDVQSYTGRGAELMEELFFAGLGQQQLISSAGRPAAWSRNPNLRFMWALRGFAMKQQALAYRNIVDNIARGNNKAAWDYMKRYALFSAGSFGLLNEFRQWLWGDGEFTWSGVIMGFADQIVSTASINTIGLNDYQWGKMMEEGVTITFIKSLEPLMTSVPRGNLGDVVDALDGEFKNNKDLNVGQRLTLPASQFPLIKQWSSAVKNVEEDLGLKPNPLTQFNKVYIQQEQPDG